MVDTTNLVLSIIQIVLVLLIFPLAKLGRTAGVGILVLVILAFGIVFLIKAIKHKK